MALKRGLVQVFFIYAETLMFGVFKRILDVSGIKSPGNGVFASFTVTYFLVFGFIFVVILQGEEAYVFNSHIWGVSAAGFVTR